MTLLCVERETIDRLLPGLDAALAEHALGELEGAHSPAIGLFRQHGGPGLLVPVALGGSGATALEAIRVHRALGARSPALAVAATMHNFSVGLFRALDLYHGEGTDLLRRVARQRLLLGSGFAEGRSGAGVLDSRMHAEPVAGGYRVRGSKKPCSLSRSMDVLTAGVTVTDPSGDTRRGVVLVPRESDGFSVRPFWKSPVLEACESHEVVLEDVFIPDACMLFTDDKGELGLVELAGWCWFLLVVSASYLGVASSLVERVLQQRKGEPVERATLAIEVEGAMSLLEGMAHWIDAQEFDARTAERALCARFAVQRAIERSAILAAELLGGMGFVASGDVAYLLAASRALAFHPPSRSLAAPFLAATLAGEPASLV